MPIKTANKKKYSKHWKIIRQRILERADYKCEGSEKYPDCRAEQYEPHPVTGSKVVLTINHKDGNPENNSDDNLAANCQRCHLSDDLELHMANSKRTRYMKKLAREKELGQKLLELENKDEE